LTGVAIGGRISRTAHANGDSELPQIITTIVASVLSLIGVVYAVLRTHKTYWEGRKVRLEAEKIRVELASIASRLPTEGASPIHERSSRLDNTSRIFSNIDYFVVLVILGNLISKTAQLVTADVPSIWNLTSGGLGYDLVFSLLESTAGFDLNYFFGSLKFTD
jgi:hypothetical protein